MGYWSIVGTGIESDAAGKTFGITLDTATNRWTVFGANVDKFLTVNSGTFKFVAIPENGTQLLNSQMREVALLKGLNGNSVVGSVGTGRASEMGVNFKWKLDSK